MPVRFLCTACHKLLSVSTRKVGSQVKCPRCQAAITVPAAEEAAALLTMFRPGGPANSAKAAHPSRRPPEDAPEFIGIDALLPETSAPLTDIPVAETRAAQAAAGDTGLVTFPRRVLYAQAILLGLVALLFFALGYVSGRIAQSGAPAAQGNRHTATAPLNQ